MKRLEIISSKPNYPKANSSNDLYGDKRMYITNMYAPYVDDSNPKHRQKKIST